MPNNIWYKFIHPFEHPCNGIWTYHQGLWVSFILSENFYPKIKRPKFYRPKFLGINVSQIRIYGIHQKQPKTCTSPHTKNQIIFMMIFLQHQNMFAVVFISVEGGNHKTKYDLGLVAPRKFSGILIVMSVIAGAPRNLASRITVANVRKYR